MISNFWPLGEGFLGFRPQIRLQHAEISQGTSFEVIWLQLKRFPKFGPVAFHYPGLYFSDQEHETVKPCDPHVAVTSIETLSKSLNEEDRECLEAAFGSLSPEHYAFHAENFDGAVKRLRRGDGDEPVQVNY